MARKKKKYKGQKALEFKTGYSGKLARIAGKRTSKGTQKFKRDKLRWPESPNQYGELILTPGTKGITYKDKASKQASKPEKQASKPRTTNAAARKAMQASAQRQHQRIANIVGVADVNDG